ncbi:MAG: hypothetical protein ABFR19_07795 [Pseudomonadota bacterium]
MKPEDREIGDFLAARGGPFYALQQQLGLLREEAFRAGPRAALFVGLAWGVPLLLSLIAGDAFGSSADRPYLLDLDAWARFFVAVALLILVERRLEERLQTHLRQFARAPLLAPGSFEAAASVVTRALRRRDSAIAEAICLALALFITLVTLSRLLEMETAHWAVHLSPQGNSLTLAGWWVVAVSGPIFWFLLLRSLWRLIVWSLLLRQLAALDLRLVATHPDGHGGLAFLGQYPNAYTMFIFAVSCVLGAVVAHELLERSLAMATYGYLMAGWLLIVLLLFTWPLAAFRKPLSDLKERTLLSCSSQATRHHRAAERELLGQNISAAGDAEPVSAAEIPDPSKALTTVRKLSVFLVNREGLLPVSAAALLPLVAAGATQLPVKEIITVVKRLLVL